MGTDIYLEWKKKTQKEKDKQRTGFSINAGDVGYLRASIGMQKENAVLRLLFPEKYWLKHITDEYDFKSHFETLSVIGFRYLVGVITGKTLDIPENQKESMNTQQKMGDIVSAIAKGYCDALSGSCHVSSIVDFRHAVMWLNSLFDFFELGIEKQEKGLKPYPYISW